jgi:alkylation response protein AidB-like acyl-CoA dehydrogenase
VRTPDDIAQEARMQFGPFLESDVNPGAVERDDTGTCFPRDLFKDLAAEGLLGYFMPKELGGGGQDALHWGITLEQVGYVCDDGSLPLVLGLCASVCRTIYDSGRSDLIDEFARPMVTGDRMGAFAYSDGADAFHFKSTARRQGQEWLLNGEKMLVTGGAIADVFMTYLRSEENDLMVFLIDRSDPGVEVTPIEVTGMRAAGLATLRLNNVMLPDWRLMVDADGLSHAQRFLNNRRVLLACGPLGRMQAIYENCVDELRQIVRYGKPLTQMPNVQVTLGRMFVAIETGRAICYRALQRIVDGLADPLFDPVVSAAKYYITDSSVNLVPTVMRVLGGGGYLKSRRYERYMRDFCGMLAGGGAQDIIEVDLGMRAVLDAERRQLKGVTRRSSGRWRLR